MNDAPSCGMQLQSAREAAGLTVEQVAERTRLRPAMVRALEADSFQACGGAVYARGHLRTFACTVGTDPAPVLEAFARQQLVADPFPCLVPEPPHSLGLAPVGGLPDGSRRWVVAGVGCLLLLGVAVGVGSRDRPAVDRDVVVAAAQTPAPRAAATPARARPAPVKPAASGTRLGLRAVGTSYVQVRAGDKVIFEAIVSRGWARTFTAPGRLRLRVGSAADLVVSCARAASGPAGEPGAVRTLICTPAGMTVG